MIHAFVIGHSNRLNVLIKHTKMNDVWHIRTCIKHTVHCVAIVHVILIYIACPSNIYGDRLKPSSEYDTRPCIVLSLRKAKIPNFQQIFHEVCPD